VNVNNETQAIKRERARQRKREKRSQVTFECLPIVADPSQRARGSKAKTLASLCTDP